MKLTDIITPRNQRYLDNVESLLPKMQQHIADGEILNQEFIAWKEVVSRLCDSTSEGLSDKWVYNGKYKSLPPELQWFDYGSGAIGVKSWIKKIAKLSPSVKQHPYVKDMETAYLRLIPYITISDELKPLVVTATQKRSELKATNAVVKQQQHTKSQTLIDVLNTYRDEYVARAGTIAEETYEWYMDKFAESGWDLDIAAPRPKSSASREAYLMAQDKRNTMSKLTVPTNPARNLRARDEDKKIDFANEYKNSALDSFNSWVHKMIQKIGKPVIAATMTGNPWRTATITVQCDDGEQQVWDSQMIINRSKYNKLFNQFPTRRKK